MKKILPFVAILFLGHSLCMAQQEKEVAEKEVKVNFVKDFQRQVKDATDVCWWQIDEQTFRVSYIDAEKSRQAMVFSNKGSETLYYIEKAYFPASIRDTVSHLFPKYTIDDVWVRKMRGKMTYQARISLRSGFLWWKKEKDSKVLNWEVDGKYIGE